MKVGDKIYCKKVYSPDDIRRYFTIDTCYTVSKLNNNYIQEFTDDYMTYIVWLQYNNNIRKDYIWKYFDTIKYIRKKKLMQICQERN